MSFDRDTAPVVYVSYPVFPVRHSLLPPNWSRAVTDTRECASAPCVLHIRLRRGPEIPDERTDATGHVIGRSHQQAFHEFRKVVEIERFAQERLDGQSGYGGHVY